MRCSPVVPFVVAKMIVSSGPQVAPLDTSRRLGTDDTDNVIVLAHAMAHEIGHLLLPYGHAATGLMRADWDAKDMRLAVHGRLNFTSEQAELIQTRLLALLADTQSLDSK